MTTDGLNVNGLPAGQRLRIGEARLEVAIVCTPCGQVENPAGPAQGSLGSRRNVMLGTRRRSHPRWRSD